MAEIENILGSALSGTNATANRTYTLVNSPVISATLTIIANGTYLQQGAGLDYTISGQIITFLNKVWNDQTIQLQYNVSVPDITDIAPSSGLVGATVTITGTGFSASGNTVTIGGTSATVTSEGTTEIQVTVPSKANGIYDVIVTNADALSDTAPNGFTVTDTTVPTFAGITQLEAVGGGMLKASWTAATGTVTSYKVYIRASSSDLFSATYLVFELPNDATQAFIRTDASDAFLINTLTCHVGVRADNNGSSDTNTETLSAIPTGDGTAVQQFKELPYVVNL